MHKHSAESGSALVDPVHSQGAVTPVPTPVVINKPAPGRRGPNGIAPRTTYSRVNTGTPPTQSFTQEQKSLAPRGMEFLPAKVAEVQMTTLAQRPTLNDMVKAAMAGTIHRANINAEASRQRGVMADDDDQEKVASATEHYSTEHVQKLAGALGFISSQLKLAESGHVQQPGEGPGALTVMEAKASDKNIDAGELGSAVSKNQPPKNPPLQAEKVQGGKANTGLETNDEMKHGKQPVEPISNEKAKLSAAQLHLQNRTRLGLVKSAEANLIAGNLARLGLAKVAEDAINPAQISAGKAVPPDASASEEGVPSVPSDVSSQAGMVASNKAAINYTKGQAKANPKSDVNQLLAQPALSKAHDPVLHTVLDNTAGAGVKISSALDTSEKVAAARALLSNLVEKVASEDEKKKEKKSMMSAPTTPSSASGFSASTL